MSTNNTLAEEFVRLADSYPLLLSMLESAQRDLAECYRLSGAVPDVDEDWRLAPLAVREVQRMRDEYDELEEVIARAGAILEALNMSVTWELAPEVNREIADVVLLIRSVVAGRLDESLGGVGDANSG